MFMKSNNGDCCSVICSCGCNDGIVLKVEKHESDDLYELAVVSDLYYVSQQARWKRFKEKIKRIWNIICNKEYRYFSIFISGDDIEEFKVFVKSL